MRLWLCILSILIASLSTAPAATAQVTPIHDIQGSGSTSPLVGQTHQVRGIVTAVRATGFYLQAPDAEADANPATSEGIFVFTNSAPPAAAVVGNLIQLAAVVTEFVASTNPPSPPLTELTSPVAASVLSTGNPLPTPVTLTSTFPAPGGAHDQLERYEGMRVTVPRLTVVAPTQGSINEPAATATSNGLFFGVVEGVERPIRTAGIIAPDEPPPGTGTIPPIPRWHGAPELIRVQSNALSGTTALDVAAGATVIGLTGPLDFLSRRYTLLPQSGAVIEGNTLTPLAVSEAQPSEYTVANLRLQRFYDTTSSGGTSITLTTQAFQNRLEKVSRLVREVMRTPDIITVQEIESLAALQALATRISTDAVAAGAADPLYASYFSGAISIDNLGTGMLVKTAPIAGGSRVNVTSATVFFATTTHVIPGGSTPLLFTRPALRIECSVRLASGEQLPLAVITAQLSAPTDINSLTSEVLWGTAGNRVRTTRYRQAAALADLLQSVQNLAPARDVILSADLQAYPFNDGYGDLTGVVRGAPSPDAETVTSSDGADLVTPDFTSLLETVPAAQRYQSAAEGAGTVTQHILVSSRLITNTSARRLEFARACADFPETARNSATTAARAVDSDPLVAYFASSSQLGVDDGLSPAPRSGLISVSPNPARGPLQVRFALTSRDPARLALHDLAGRLVASHDLSSPTPGEHVWVTAAGQALPPGVYHLRLSQGSVTQARRVVVMR